MPNTQDVSTLQSWIVRVFKPVMSKYGTVSYDIIADKCHIYIYDHQGRDLSIVFGLITSNVLPRPYPYMEDQDWGQKLLVLTSEIQAMFLDARMTLDENTWRVKIVASNKIEYELKL